MLHNVDDTIAAIASAPGGALRGIVRMSGPETVCCLERCFQPQAALSLSSVKRAEVLSGCLSACSPIGSLPCDLFLWPSDRSYTRQVAAEIHTLGSPPLLEAVLKTLCDAGARLAESGEFTMRAFLAGRLDLTQAEAVLGVIDAANSNELDLALNQLAGGLAGPLGDLRDRLLELLAHLEAGLDFVEEDIEFISQAVLLKQLAKAAESIEQVVRQLDSRTNSASGPRVVLSGWPNVGKSSLLNALSSSDAAIVSHRPGATRDYLTRQADMDGLPCLLIDTAGVNPQFIQEQVVAQKQVAVAAQQLTGQQIKQADLQILCLDASRPLNDWEREQLVVESPLERIVVLTKVDEPRRIEKLTLGGIEDEVIETSSLNNSGIETLRREIRHRLETSEKMIAHAMVGGGDRCRESLQQAGESLGRASELAENGLGEELIAVEVRTALDELGKVVGMVYTDDLLDQIFSRFCIGK